MSVFDEHITSKLSDIDTIEVALRIIVEDSTNIIRDMYQDEIQFNRSSICKRGERLQDRKEVAALKKRIILSIQQRDGGLSTLNPDIEIYMLDMYSYPETFDENVELNFSIYIPNEEKTATYISSYKTYKLPGLDHFELTIDTPLYKK